MNKLNFQAMKKNVLLIAIIMIALFGFQSCSNDNDKTIDNTARVQLKLVDVPGDYEEVNIEIIDVLINSPENGGDWTSITPDDFTPIIVDLTELIGGAELLLADVIVPSGMLKEVRLVLGDNNTLLIEGKSDPVHLDTPSAQQSGLKIKINTQLEPGYSYTFIFDWNVDKSIVKAGNSGKYLLKPVIRVNAEVNSGSIKGKVVGPAMEGDGVGPVPLKGAKVRAYTIDGVEEAGTFSDGNGNFIIRGLDPGDYKIKIEHINYINYESGTINVIVGEVSDTGTIELKVPVN